MIRKNISILLITLSALFALSSLVLAILGFFELSMAGFPDGSVTDYERATAKYLKIIFWLLFGTGAYFVFIFVRLLVAERHVSKSDIIQFWTLITVTILLIIVLLVIIPWYFESYLNLNNGRGG